MRAAALLSLVLACAWPAASAAQQEGDGIGFVDGTGGEVGTVTPDSFRAQATPAVGATLRWLDKMVGSTSDVELQVGQTAAGGAIQITLEECRYPTGNPAGDAWARLTVQSRLDGSIVFSGWMIASAPALNAMDHARYDVWVLRCKTS